jgi:AraC family transcriptional regulator
VLANFETVPFTELPCTFGRLHGAVDRSLLAAPWNVAHDYGVLLYCPASFAQAHIQLHHHVIGIELNPGIVRTQFNDGPMIDNVLKSCAMYFLPAGSAIEVRKEQPIEFMLATIDPTLAKHLMPDDHDTRYAWNIVDAALAAKAMELRRRLLGAEFASELATDLVESALTVLTPYFRIDQQHTNLRMSSNRIRRALDFIGANSTAKISVEDIADAVGGISPFHFAHMFAETLGQSPHQYILEHRLRLARDMLTKATDDIADIAYAVGFSDQAHMTETFRRKVGVTPAQMRRLAAAQIQRERG